MCYTFQFIRTVIGHLYCNSFNNITTLTTCTLLYDIKVLCLTVYCVCKCPLRTYISFNIDVCIRCYHYCIHIRLMHVLWNIM